MSWYVAITNPGCHRRAEHGLAAIGYQAFWPKFRKWVSHARTRIPKEYPVLGRYLFVEIPDKDFYSVRNVHGLEALLTGDNGSPASVHPEIVWAFRDRYMRGEWDLIAQSQIPIGARIRIMEGEFADMIAVVRGRRNGKLQFVRGEKFHSTREDNVRAT